MDERDVMNASSAPGATQRRRVQGRRSPRERRDLVLLPRRGSRARARADAEEALLVDRDEYFGNVCELLDLDVQFSQGALRTGRGIHRWAPSGDEQEAAGV